jgi:hypothetical protein
MPFCPSCKVSLAPSATTCPLCHSRAVESLDQAADLDAGDPHAVGGEAHAQAVHSARAGSAAAAVGSGATAATGAVAPTCADGHPEVSWSASVRNAEHEERLSPREKRVLTVELLSVSLGIVLAVTVILDFLISGTITWSRYTSLVIVMAYLCSAMPLILWGHPWLVFAVLGPSLVLAVFLWAVCTGDLSWFLLPALPIALLTEAVVVASATLIRVSKTHGLNVVAIVISAVAVLCAGIELSLEFHLGEPAGLSWSAIVVCSVVPVAGFFFYLHYRIMRQASLRKLFRL